DLNLKDQQMQTITFDYESKALKRFKNKKLITKELITSYLKINYPMIIKPKDWKITNTNVKKIIGNNITLYDTGVITNGGYLLNNYFFKKCLQKNINKGHLHKLAISSQCIETINKIQKIPYRVNKPLLELLI